MTMTLEEVKIVQAKAETGDKDAKRTMRIHIAQEAIRFIECGRLIARSGSYLGFPNSLTVDSADDHIPEARGDMRTFFESQPLCNACGVAAIFFATVMVCDEITFEEFTVPRDNVYRQGSHLLVQLFADRDRKLMAKFFSRRNIALIEVAFEGKAYGSSEDHVSYSDEDYAEAVAFCHRYQLDSHRLLAILRNIVDNGQFEPSR